MAKEFRDLERLSGPDALRVFRARHRISQERFGQLIGMRGPAISDYERGASRPDLTTATKIEMATGGDVPATSWVDTSSFGHFAEQRVENLANSDEPASASVGRGRGAAA